MGAAVVAQRARRGGALNRTQGCADTQRPHVGLRSGKAGSSSTPLGAWAFREPLARPGLRRLPV